MKGILNYFRILENYRRPTDIPQFGFPIDEQATEKDSLPLDEFGAINHNMLEST